MSRKPYSDFTPEQKQKDSARARANQAEKQLRLLKQPCVVCASDDAQKHHPDYEKPLEVIWVCRPCHLKLHQEDPEVTRIINSCEPEIPYPVVPRESKYKNHGTNQQLCSACGNINNRKNQRYCHSCHASYERDWRKMPRKSLRNLIQKHTQPAGI